MFKTALMQSGQFKVVERAFEAETARIVWSAAGGALQLESVWSFCPSTGVVGRKDRLTAMTAEISLCEMTMASPLVTHGSPPGTLTCPRLPMICWKRQRLSYKLARLTTWSIASQHAPVTPCYST